MNIPNSLSIGGLSLLLCSLAAAAPYAGSAYEPFDYLTVVDGVTPAIDSNPTSNQRGTGWNATGDPALANTTVWGGGVTTAPLVVASSTVIAGSLAHPVPPVAHRIEISPPGTASGNAGRALGQSVDSGSLYFSFAVQRLTDSIRTINFALFAGTIEKFGFGQYATSAVAATSAGNLAGVFLNSNPANLVIGSPGTVPIPMGTGVMHLVIIRIDFNTSGVNDRVRVYVDPVSLADEDTLTPYINNANFDMTAITTLRPFAGGSTTTPVALASASAAFDEIRVGSTFASVTTPIVPSLEIVNQQGAILLNWPASFSWCFLQQNPLLNPGPWTNCEGVEDNGTTRSLSVLSPGARQFFRLARP